MNHKLRFYWHMHHDVLVEPTTDVQERMDYITANKPAKELPTRMRLMQLVRGNLPPEVLKAWDACLKAWDAYDKAWDAYAKAEDACLKARDAYAKAWDAYAKAVQDHMPEIEALHQIECPDCPWNGETIFPGKEE